MWCRMLVLLPKNGAASALIIQLSFSGHISRDYALVAPASLDGKLIMSVDTVTDAPLGMN